jgi:hypothetical protein
MTSSTVVLVVVVSLFEMDMEAKGGFFKFAEESSFHDTLTLDVSYWIHMVLVSVTSLAWLVLVPLSWWRFGKPPKPGTFSKTHRLLGRIGLIGMVLTSVSGVELCAVAFTC